MRRTSTVRKREQERTRESKREQQIALPSACRCIAAHPTSCHHSTHTHIHTHPHTLVRGTAHSTAAFDGPPRPSGEGRR